MRDALKVALIMFLFATCSEPELPSKSYPYVVMTEVNTLDDGVEFVAEFKSLGDKSITRYGFLWWEGTPEKNSGIYEREIESLAEIGSFSLSVTSDLENGRKYQVRPFAENAQTTVLGDIFEFESKGTNAPEFDDFFPKSGGPGDVITITGSNFSLSKTRIKVYLGVDNGIVISTDVNEIKFKLPENLSTSGEVPLSLRSGGIMLNHTEPFLIEGQQITAFSPKQGIIGETEITITGNGFLQSGNKVRIGEYEGVILEESQTQIKLRLPYEMQAGVVPVEVDVNGQVAVAPGMFTIKSRWVRLADFPGTPRLDAFHTIVGNFLYVIGGETGVYSDEVWKYNFANNTWTRLPNFPGGGRNHGLGFAIGSTIYYGLGGGSGGIDDFWAYNTLTGQWNETHSLGSLQGPPITTSINGVGYILGGGTDGNYSFTEQTGWTYLGIPTSVSVSTYYDSYFEIGGQPYVLDMITYANSGEKIYNLYMVDKSSPASWDLKSTVQAFTKKDYNAICFVSNDLVYLGEGVSSIEDRKFVRLNVNTNQWTQIENFQGPLVVRSGISFSYNNKGYFGLGLTSQSGPNLFGPSNQFWVYDPSIN